MPVTAELQLGNGVREFVAPISRSASVTKIIAKTPTWRWALQRRDGKSAATMVLAPISRSASMAKNRAGTPT